ncbi:MAG: LPS-assembly protein LptD [Chitinophagaceae bacterium]|nr:LPS-assembly protein LptD [Chitinophagaceae bacterium]
MKQLHEFTSKFLFSAILTVAIFCTLTCRVEAQRITGRNITRPLTGADTVKPRLPNATAPRVIANTADTKAISDSSRLNNDSLPLRTDTFSLKLSKDTLDAPVNYAADDSAVVLIADKRIILYGKTKTEYKDINLTAPQVELDQQSQVLTAYNHKDSTGQVTEEAHFVQGENSFTSDTIRYNFKTQKGFTINTITQQGEMFVHGAQVKKVDEKVTFVKNGLFTTCNLDEPHFAFKAERIKVVNQKLAVSGPAHPEFEGVPVPVILPFGFFPLSQGRHSGLLPPQFETNDQFGIGLTNLGYYKVMNNYWDVKVYGNIYSYGGWSANINPTYRKRYRYSGAFNFGLQRTKFNFKGDPDYFTNKSYTLTWNHQVDSRARPGTTFSASVNASSTSYNKYVSNNPMQNYNNLLGSSIAYSKTWTSQGAKSNNYNLTVSANHNQNNQTGLVSLSLPDIGFSVSTMYPFQKAESVGSKKWYEQLGIGYNGNFRNQLAFYDSAFKLRNLIDTLQWGARHSIPITLSLPPILGGAVVVSPSISYSQVWINQKFQRTWNNTTKKIDTTVTKGFYMDHQSSMGISFNTALYGTYQFKKSKIYAIRHVIRPSISLNYQPDLSGKHFYTTQVDTSGYTARFSEFEGALYTGFGEGRYGGMSFQLDNNLEMKLRPKKSKESTDTTGEKPDYKKIRLIDGYGFSTSYNFFADSMKLAPFQMYFRTNLFDKINISANATMDPYQTDSRGRSINKYAWSSGKFKPGRITTGSVSLSTNFQSKPRDDKKEKQKQQQLNALKGDPTLIGDQQRLLDYMRQNPSEFVDFNIPWSFNLSYSLYFREQFKSDYSGFEKIFTSTANFSGNFSLTPKWMFSVNGYYDIDTRSLQTFQMSISREMHCWQMSINVTPIGPYRYFNFTINPKSGILQDLRINRTRSFYTGY